VSIFCFLSLLLAGGFTARADWSLVVAGAPRNYGAPVPLGYGTNGAIAVNAWITNGVESPVAVNGTNWGCYGWALKKTTGGAAVANGPGTQAVFQMTTNLTLTWNWTNYVLTVAGSPAPVGSPSPQGYGANSNLAANTWITNSVAGSVTLNGTNWGSKGWALKRTTGGAPVTNGAGTEAVFAMTTNLTLTWSWTNYWLAIGGNPANYGSPAPLGYGTFSNIADAAWVTNAVVTPAGESGGTRRASLGWNLRYANGTPIDSGSETQTVFQMRADSLVLTWNWTNEYYLGISANSNGAVDTAPVGWYTNGLQAQATATADPGAVFVQWSGDVPSENRTDNPVILVMDQPRTIQAQFAAGAPTNRVWNGIGNWFSVTNWTPRGIPGTGDVVFISSGTNTLSDPVDVEAVTVSNATLSFSGWDTVLRATNVLIASGGLVTHVGNSDTAAPWAPDARVWIACSNLTVAVNGSISAADAGYKGGYGNSTILPCGPGANSSGGAYGGRGGSTASLTYGSLTAPEDPGSGGGGRTAGGSWWGGAGGGAIRIDASGVVTVRGSIAAQGASAGYGSGGSGGSVWISCNTFSGSNGFVKAEGGSGDPIYRGGGGGGRIAIVYDTTAQGSQPVPGVTVSVRPGGGSLDGDVGTVYFPDTKFLTEVVSFNGELTMDGFTNWAPATLTVSNAWVRFPKNLVKITVPGRVTVLGTDADFHKLELNNGIPLVSGSVLLKGGSLVLRSAGTTNSLLDCAGDLSVTNGGRLDVYSGMTNGTSASNGALVECGGDITVATNSWIMVYSHPIDGGSPLFRMKNLSIAKGGSVKADYSGYAAGFGNVAPARNGLGPGGGGLNGGGGYGGKGGHSAGGNTYDSSNAPVGPGSGGGGSLWGSVAYWGGTGGGAVQIMATNTVSIDGTISANGTQGNAGGGSGGAVHIRCETFRGSGGLIQAKGGRGLGYQDTGCGGGGGGRIAIWRKRDYSSGVLTAVDGGLGGIQAGFPGTVVWGQLPGLGTIMMIR
jgi:hypothetical protein